MSKKSLHCTVGSVDAVKAEVYFQVDDFCQEQRKKLEIVEFHLKKGIPFVRCASAELRFRCTDRPLSDPLR